jgi:ADP-ribose pyrophosphatase
LPSGNFRKLSERPVYGSALLHVAVATFEAPDGSHFERDIVHHPGAVVMVPLDEETGEVVLVRQFRAPLDTEVLEVPAGKRDVDGEPPEVTARRELAEETGLEAGKLELIGRFFNSPGFSDEQHMTVERVKFSEVGAMVRSGEITDAKTIVGFFLAQAALALEEER